MHAPPIDEADGDRSSRALATVAQCCRDGAGITLVSFGDFNPRVPRQLERV